MQKTANSSSEIPYKAELLRKSLHLLALVIPAGMFYLDKYTYLSILVPTCMLAIFLEVARVRSQAIANHVDRIFGRIMRSTERPQIGGPVAINGATWILLSSTLLVFIFPVQVAAVSMFTFIISDAVAALVGRRLGRFKWGNSTKTIEGSLAFFIVALFLLLIFEILSVQECLLAAFGATVLELIPLPINDNLYVPISLAGLIFCLLKFVHEQDLVLFF